MLDMPNQVLKKYNKILNTNKNCSEGEIEVTRQRQLGLITRWDLSYLGAFCGRLNQRKTYSFTYYTVIRY
jgi:hypothetical protein